MIIRFSQTEGQTVGLTGRERLYGTSTEVFSVDALPVNSSEDCDNNKNFYHCSCNANTLHCKNIIYLSYITITYNTLQLWAGLKSPLISGQQVQVQLTDSDSIPALEFHSINFSYIYLNNYLSLKTLAIKLLRASDRLINLACKCTSTEIAIIESTTTTTTTTTTTMDKQMAGKCFKSPLAQAMPSFLISCSFQTLLPRLRHDLKDVCCQRRESISTKDNEMKLMEEFQVNILANCSGLRVHEAFAKEHFFSKYDFVTLN
uniref:Uncharacterized protein n=1 Tax=Glossina austeni TaxID=7395 RepID=A0A1A9UP90_GLOAU